jgi:hypothetical protein
MTDPNLSPTRPVAPFDVAEKHQLEDKVFQLGSTNSKIILGTDDAETVALAIKQHGKIKGQVL